MMLVKNNTVHLYRFKPDSKIFYRHCAYILRQKSALIASLVIMVIFLALLSGCGTAFVSSKQDDLITQIDVWAVENEYAKAFATLDYVKTSHPQYQLLQKRKATLLIEAGDYEKHVDKQIQQFIKDNQWTQALDLLDQAEEKYSGGEGLAKTEKYLLAQQQHRLAAIDKEIMLQRSQWMIKTQAYYEEKLNTDPRNKTLKKQLDHLNNEAKQLAEKLTQLSTEALDKKHYKTARIRINQAIAIETSQHRREIRSKLQHREKKSQNRNHKIQHDTLMEDIEESYKTGDFLKAKQLTLTVDKKEQKSTQLIQLKQAIEYSIDDKIEQLMSEANKNYTNGKFNQAIELWDRVLQYEPENTLAQQNIRRAEEVIDKLMRLREKQ